LSTISTMLFDFREILRPLWKMLAIIYWWH